MISAFLLMAMLPQDQGELLYDEAITFMNAGKYKEALADLETILATYADTDWAPKALLQIGNYHLKVLNDSAGALEKYSKIQTDFPRSAEVPAALFFKALIVERQGLTRAELEGAAADLVRMGNLYPDNPWQEGALFLFGKLSQRLGEYTLSLNNFQRLEFNFPHSPNLPDALLYSARSAYLKGEPGQAMRVLARLQSKFPNAEAAETAAAYLRLLDRFQSGKISLQPDRAFFGAAPKRFSSPTDLLVSKADVLAIKDGKGTYLVPLDESQPRETLQPRDLVGFSSDRDGAVLLVFKNRIAYSDGNALNSGDLSDIRDAAMDAYGRLFVIDDDEKDLFALAPDGSRLHRFGLNRPKLVRCFGSDVWVLANDGNSISVYGSNFALKGSTVPAPSGIIDFKFDPFGNVYFLHDKGNVVSVATFAGQNR